MTNDLLVSAIAGSAIGTGHLRRMLTLAHELSRQPGPLISLHSSDLGLKIARSSGLTFDSLHTGPERAEAAIEGLVRIVKARTPEILVLDNYFWQAETEALVRPHCGRLCVVDDLADRPHDTDILLDQNANHQADDYVGFVPETCTLAVGPRFCLISKPFQLLRQTAYVSPETRAKRNRVFVSLGGGDPQRDLPRLLDLLIRGTDLAITVATGSHIPDVGLIRNMAARHPDRVELVLDSPRVAEQMNSAGFAVAAGGTMTWERAALGLPTLCLIVADNQLDTAYWMEERGLHRSFDLRGTWREADLLAAVLSYATDYAARKAQARASAALIDGTGCARAAQAILTGRLPR